MREIKRFIFENSDKLLISGSIVSTIGAAVSSAIATNKAGRDIRRSNHELVESGHDWLKPIEKIQIGWKYYIPTALFVSSGVFCVLKLNDIHVKKEAALLSSLAISYKYREKVLERFGDDSKIFSELRKDQAIEDIKNCTDEFELEDDEYLYYEPVSGQLFKADENKIMEANLVVNRLLARDWGVRFNEYLEFLGLETRKEDEYLGWWVTDGEGMWDWNWSFNQGNPWVDITTENFTDELGRDIECLVYNFLPDFNPDEDIAVTNWPKDKS